MLEGRTQNNIIMDESDTDNSNIEFYKLKQTLLSSYAVTDDTINILKEKLSFEMEFNQISAQQLLNHLEAEIVNNKNEIDENMIIENLMKGVGEFLKKNKGKKKGNMYNKHINNMNNGTKNIQYSSNSNIVENQQFNKEVRVENLLTYNEKGLIQTNLYNSKEISYTFFSNLEINEYTLIPKDEEVKLDEYQKYFQFFKNIFLESIGIVLDNPLLDIDKFFLLVTFDTTEGKPVMTDIVLIDPLKNYARYLLKIENENHLKDYYFFCGQMIYIEGHLKNNEIFAQKIIFGIPAAGYTLSEIYIKGFFQEPSPYLIYAVNGPIFNKTDFDLNLFFQTLNYIANDNPHALIINGPILNCDNLIIASGEINLGIENHQNYEGGSTNYFDAFEYILEQIIKIFNDKKTTIILCPSLNDATTFYPLPLPPYNFSYLNRNVNNSEFIRKGRLKLIGNPQLFQLNEIIFGVANFDVVKDMISNSVRSSNKIPLDSSLDMIIQQRSFYPLLPNTVTDDIDQINKIIYIDERKIKNFHLNAIPDVIITSASNMNPFVKKTSNTLFINPGSLYKGANPGSFLKIASYPPNNLTGIDIIGRLKVDVLKLNFK